MALYPYGRIAHLLKLESPNVGPYGHTSTTSPTTISGGENGIQSYNLTIGYHDRERLGFWVYDAPNSPTTNRHIRALIATLEYNGYERTDETRTDRGAWDRTYPYRFYALT